MDWTALDSTRVSEVAPKATLQDTDEVHEPTREYEQTRIGHRTRPLRDGGGLPSPGRFRPSRRPLPRLLATTMALTHLAQSCCLITQVETMLARKDKTPAFTPEILGQARAAISESFGFSGPLTKTDGQPFYLDLRTGLLQYVGDQDRILEVQ